MGKCKVNDTFLGKFTCVKRISGDLFHVKCNVCAISNPISLEKGAQSWTQHENTATHKAAIEMGGASAQTVERCLARSVDIGTATRKATILHVLNLVLQKHSFRSSDPFSRKQGLYAKMFPDSAFTSINCGKTKAKYIAVHGLAPYAKTQIQKQFSSKLFGLHVGETRYNNKTPRLEFWVYFFNDSERKLHYLTTVEVHARFDVDEFLTSRLKSVDEIKMVDADAIYPDLRKKTECRSSKLELCKTSSN